MGGKVSSFFKDNIGTVLSDVGLGVLTVVQPELAPFTIATMAGTTGAAIAGQIGKDGAEKRMRATNKHVQAMLEEAKAMQAVQLNDMKSGAYGADTAASTIKALAAIQAGAPLSAALSAANVSPAVQIGNMAVKQAMKKNIGGGISSGAAEVATHFGNPLAMTSRSWASGKTGAQARGFLVNHQIANLHAQMTPTAEARSADLQAGGGSQSAAVQTGALRTNVQGTQVYGQTQ